LEPATAIKAKKNAIGRIQPLPGKSRARAPAEEDTAGHPCPLAPLGPPLAGGKVARFMVLLEELFSGQSGCHGVVKM
jgi:hypothetical protein